MITDETVMDATLMMMMMPLTYLQIDAAELSVRHCRALGDLSKVIAGEKGTVQV